MLGFMRKGRKGGAAVAEPEGPESLDELLAEIRRLTDENRRSPQFDSERRLLTLRHHAGLRLLAPEGTQPAAPEADAAGLPGEPGSLPEFRREELTPELLRAAILRDGCALVRGLVEPEQALRLADLIAGSVAARAAADAGAADRDGLFDEFAPEPPYVVDVRGWIAQGGGVLAVDAPKVAFEMLETFRAAGIDRLAGGYLGEPPLISSHKTTLRKAEPVSVTGAWHQDGKFMGEVRALNLWLSLSRCGDEAPGLDIVPRRLDEVVQDRGEDAKLDYVLTQERAEEVARDAGTEIRRPIFEPGDALFFDELFLHQTGSDPSMAKPRFAIESWFFGGSGFPAGYAPVAV
jgi:hypothetical protein